MADDDEDVPQMGDLGALGGLGDLFSQLQSARADLEAQAEAIEATVVEGRVLAGGAVVITITGSLGAESVHIDPSIIDPADPALLEDAVLAALRDALGRIVGLRSEIQAPADPPFAGGVDLEDLGALVGNLDLEGLLGGVDLDALVGNLGMGLDLGVLGGFRALRESDDEDDDNDDGDDDIVDDEPEA